MTFLHRAVSTPTNRNISININISISISINTVISKSVIVKFLHIVVSAATNSSWQGPISVPMTVCRSVQDQCGAVWSCSVMQCRGAACFRASFYFHWYAKFSIAFIFFCSDVIFLLLQCCPFTSTTPKFEVKFKWSASFILTFTSKFHFYFHLLQN